MPQIRPYETGPLALRPSEIGVDAQAGAARRVGAFSNQLAGATDELARNTENLGSFEGSLLKDTGNRIGSSIKDAGDAYVAYEDHKEISHGAAVSTDLFTGLEKQWSDTLKTANPNDPSVGAKFMDTVVKPSLEKFQNGDDSGQTFTTENSQKYAEGIVDRFRQHFATKTTADMSTMAGIAAKENAAKTINGLSSAAYMDPSSLDTSIDILKHSAGAIVDSSPTIDAETGARVKAELNQKGIESIVKSAVSGMIAKNPNVDLDAIQKKYGDYINGGELKMFQAAAQRQAKTDAAAARADVLQQKQLADQQVHAASTKAITDNVAIDPQSGQPVISPKFFKDALDIARNNPNAPAAAATARTMLDWGESQQNKETKITTDPTVKAALTDKFFDPDHPTTRLDLMKAQTAGKLSDHDFTGMERLVTELEQSPLKGPVWQSTLAAAKDSLIVSVPGIIGKDNKGIENYSSFMQTFVPQYLAKSRAGTLPANALDTKDPNSMISQAMAPFKRTAADRMADYVAGAGGLSNAGTTPAAAPKVDGVTVPAPLRGIAALQRNKTTGQFRDQTTGKIYDAQGNEVGR